MTEPWVSIIGVLIFLALPALATVLTVLDEWLIWGVPPRETMRALLMMEEHHD